MPSAVASWPWLVVVSVTRITTWTNSTFCCFLPILAKKPDVVPVYVNHDRHDHVSREFGGQVAMGFNDRMSDADYKKLARSSKRAKRGAVRG